MTGRLRRVVVAAAVLLTAVALPGSSAPGDPTLRFSAAGDFSSSAAAQSVFSTIGGLHNDLHLALGDLSYGVVGAEQQWCDLVKAGVGEGYPFELVSGNHESNGQNGNINDFSACLPNQLPGAKGTYGRQYFMDVPQSAPLVRFIQISPDLPFPDSTWSYAAGTPRYQWTAAAIDSARAAGIPWVVVSMHKPCLSMGDYACDPGADLLNLLLTKRVDLVLTGHEHLYQRTKQLALRTGCTSVTPGTFTSACVADSDSTMLKGAGTVFATVGTGGINLRDVNAADSEAGYFATTSGLNQNPTWGVLDVSATSTQLSASFARASGGTFADAFTLTAGPPPPNQAPVAVFTPTCAQLACTGDASASGDPDGTVTAWAWQWGDGTTGSGQTATHTYAAAGTYTITLTVTDDAGATGTTTQQVTVAAANQSPTAAFTRDCDDLSCAFDAGPSTDPDGTIASWAWQFGDGGTATTASAVHAYAAAGTYTVRLTVTDNQGATGTTTTAVTVTTPPPPVTVVAADAFGRTLASGWGTADTGGAWTSTGAAANLSVGGGFGRLRLAAGSGQTVALGSVSSSGVDILTTYALDKVPTGSGHYVSVLGRRISTAGDYRAKVHLTSNGGVGLSLQRATTAGAETALAAETTVPGVTLAAGDQLRVRVQVVGTSPTTVRARVWKVGATEPATWQKTVTDATAGFQVAGSLGFYGYLSGSATNGPVTMSVDDLVVNPSP
ncbi:hypothetical protein ASD62_07795 [Phycicoccus sp. Root563]|uniref:PKD domain-containing protein n=1 Tax=Phycicoccus sp. Root563 TaxID=1736562 RepID=UPI0007035D30|nr:PKD domain-containing protein [Phycicoccus sp. Root563]KQZ89224.1 hypothetical protein ASD62_07795 [Phycicoccus sp. Root563]